MEWFFADGYDVAREVVQRGVALVYLLAFINVLDEWRPLVGVRGLLPVDAHVARTSWRTAPSLLRLAPDDRAITACAVVGGLTSALLVAGVVHLGPGWLTMLAFALLWVLYLSLVNIGQVFTAFGWETLLLEVGLLAVFLGGGELGVPWVTLLALRWLLIRVELGAGLIKWRGDPCWRALSCTRYHHETQPLPGPWSWRFHHLPEWQHRAEVAANHVVQLVVPFGLLFPQPVAGGAALLIVVTQVWLLASGNFAWLNLLTIVIAGAAIPDDGYALIGVEVSAGGRSPAWYVAAVAVFAVVIAWRSLPPLENLLSRDQRMNASHDPLRLVNSYGAFGAVTRTRHQVVIEALDPDAAPATTTVAGRGGDWRAYVPRAQPQDPFRRPPQIAPYHRRLDWLLWFASLHPKPGELFWLRRLLAALLDADPQVLGLLRSAPFGDRRPAAVRVVRWRYRFTTRSQRRRTGAWWVCDRPEVVVGPVRPGEVA